MANAAKIVNCFAASLLLQKYDSLIFKALLYVFMFNDSLAPTAGAIYCVRVAYN